MGPESTAVQDPVAPLELASRRARVWSQNRPVHMLPMQQPPKVVLFARSGVWLAWASAVRPATFCIGWRGGTRGVERPSRKDEAAVRQPCQAYCGAPRAPMDPARQAWRGRELGTWADRMGDHIESWPPKEAGGRVSLPSAGHGSRFGQSNWRASTRATTVRCIKSACIAGRSAEHA
jgi:hypothetical protein